MGNKNHGITRAKLEETAVVVSYQSSMMRSGLRFSDQRMY